MYSTSMWYSAKDITHYELKKRGRHDRMVDSQLPMLSVPITTDVVSANLDQGKVYNIMW